MEKGGEADAFFLVLFNQFLFSSIRMDICYLLSASHVTFFFLKIVKICLQNISNISFRLWNRGENFFMDG